jgi:hypothetical protein
MHDADDTPRFPVPFGDRARRAGSAGEVEGAVNGPPLNERSYRRLADAAELVRPLHRAEDRGREEEEPGYVIHLPIRVADLTAATTLAGRVADTLGYLSELDAGETTVSTADDQNNRQRVFCDLLLADRSRCPQPYDHPGPCGQAAPTPGRRPHPRPFSGP